MWGVAIECDSGPGSLLAACRLCGRRAHSHASAIARGHGSRAAHSARSGDRRSTRRAHPPRPPHPHPEAPARESPLPPSPTPVPTQLVASTAVPGPSPMPVADTLISQREDGIFIGDGWGAGNRQVLSLGSVTSMAFHDGKVAYVVDGSILVADLRSGAPIRVADAPPAFLLGPDLYWTADGQALLTISDREDTTAKQTGRRIDIGVVALPGGPWRPGLALADRAGVTILQASSATSQVLLVAWGAEPTFKEALRYSLTDGRLVATLPMAGEGEVVASPDGRLALTTLLDRGKDINSSLVYDLGAGTPTIRYRQEHPARTHAVSHIWAPDGKRVAYLLREGRAFWDAPGRGLGIWIWDLEKQKATKVAEATDPASCPVAWTPDGRHLIYRQVDVAGANAYYALAVEEGKARLLPVDPASSILGWMSGTPIK